MIKSKDLVDQYRQRTGFISTHEFGGGLLKNSHAKTARPHSRKRPIHFIFSIKRKWHHKMTERSQQIFLKRKLQKLSKQFEVRLKNMKIEKGRFQIIIQSEDRKKLHHFIRSIAGNLSRQLTGLQKGRKKGEKESIYEQRPFSRILQITRIFARAFYMSQIKELIVARCLPPTSKLRMSSA